MRHVIQATARSVSCPTHKVIVGCVEQVTAVILKLFTSFSPRRLQWASITPILLLRLWAAALPFLCLLAPFLCRPLHGGGGRRYGSSGSTAWGRVGQPASPP